MIIALLIELALVVAIFCASSLDFFSDRFRICVPDDLKEVHHV